MKVCVICNIQGPSFKFVRGNANPTCKKCKAAARKKYGKEYRLKNKSKILESNRLYKEGKRKNDPSFRLSNNCSRMINHALNGSKNNYSIWKFLPYEIQDLIKHLESKFDSNMSWENYGSYWHLDHIIPQSSFPYKSMKDDLFIKCWDLSNLQPLEAIANIKKSNKV